MRKNGCVSSEMLYRIEADRCNPLPPSGRPGAFGMPMHALSSILLHPGNDVGILWAYVARLLLGRGRRKSESCRHAHMMLSSSQA